MKYLDFLLENFWITKEEDTELFYKIKDKSNEFKEFVETKLGYRFIANQYIIKLEKLPGIPENWMGIKEFDDITEYILLCLVICFLEDKFAKEQFMLSQLVEYVDTTFALIDTNGVVIDWNLYKNRKAMTKVLQLIKNLNMIKVTDGDETGFLDEMTNEVLYESTGISRYFMRNFIGNVYNYNSYQDIQAGECFDLQQDRGILRRQRVYRRLILAPVVYQELSDDPDYEYIKNYRGMLAKDLETYLQSELQVHKNMAVMVLEESKNYKDVFPSGKAISDIVCQINKLIYDKVNKKQLELSHSDTITVSEYEFIKLIESCRELNMTGWSKEYREMSIDKLKIDIINYMSDFGMIYKQDNDIKLMPLIGKINGRYPKNFQGGGLSEQ